MRYIRDLFILISFLPFLSTLYIGALNLNKETNLRILIWENNEISIGKLIIMAGTIGLSLSTINILIINYTTILNSKAKEVDEIQNNNIEYENDIPIETEFPEYIERDISHPTPTIAVPYKIISNNTGENNINEYSEQYIKHDKLYQNDIDLTEQINDQEKLSESWIFIDLENW